MQVRTAPMRIMKMATRWKRHCHEGGCGETQKRIIDKVRKEEEDRLYEQGKAQEEKEIINDLNLFPPKPNNSPIPNELMGDKEKESQPNYLVYGLIGLGVIVGAFLIFKKK